MVRRVPARRQLLPQPRDYAINSRDWPDGDLKPGCPREAVLAQHIARTLKRAMEAAGHDPRKAVTEAELGYGTIRGLLSGESWSTLPTLAALEQSYGIQLWVTQRDTLKSYPRDYLAKGDAWPDGRLRDGAPPEAVLAREASQRLLAKCRSRFEDHDADRGFDLDRAAAVAELAPTTIADLLDGRIWGDLPTIARIEGRLEVPMWADQLPRRDDYRRS